MSHVIPERNPSNSSYQEPSHGTPPPRRKRPWLTSLVVLGAIAIVAVPILIAEVPREVARWYVAAAAEQHDGSDLAGALATVTQAMNWHPDAAAFYRVRGSWKLEMKDFVGSLADLNQAVALAPTDPANLVDRSIVLQHLGRHREAVNDWNEVVRLNRDRNSLTVQRYLTGRNEQFDVYNARAYACALAKTELDAALKDLARAIEKSGENAAFLDTRGFLHYQRGELQAARRDMDRAVSLAEAQLSQWPEIRNRLRHEVVERRDLDRHEIDLRRNVAVIRYHRALVLQRENNYELAEKDLKRVQELGFQPDDQLF